MDKGNGIASGDCRHVLSSKHILVVIVTGPIGSFGLGI
jgi:hypothetical protein